MIKTTVIEARYGEECSLHISYGRQNIYVNIVQEYILISRKPMSEMTERDFDVEHGMCVGFDRLDGEEYYQDFDGYYVNNKLSSKVCAYVVSQIDRNICMYRIFPQPDLPGLISHLMGYRIRYEYKEECLLDVTQDRFDAICKEFLDMYEEYDYVTPKVIRQAYADALSTMCWDGTAIPQYAEFDAADRWDELLDLINTGEYEFGIKCSMLDITRFENK